MPEVNETVQQTIQTPPVQTPAAAPQIDPNEYAKYREAAGKYEQLTGRLTKSELTELSDDDLALLHSIRKAKVPHKDVIGAIGTYQDEFEKQQNTAGLTPKQIQELVDKQSSEMFEKRWSERETKSNAQREYERLLEAQENGFAGIRKELGLPDRIPDDDLHGRFVEAAINGLKYGHLIKNGFYGDDHPLKGSVRPLGQESVAEIREFVGKAKEFLTARKQIEDAKKAVRTAPTGSTGTGGETSKKDTAEDARDADAKKVENVIRERQKRRAATTTSTSA